MTLFGGLAGRLLCYDDASFLFYSGLSSTLWIYNRLFFYFTSSTFELGGNHFVQIMVIECAIAVRGDTKIEGSFAV